MNEAKRLYRLVRLAGFLRLGWLRDRLNARLRKLLGKTISVTCY